MKNGNGLRKSLLEAITSKRSNRIQPKDETGIFAYTRRRNLRFLHKWIKEVRDDYEY